MNLRVNKKTGFYCQDENILIFDDKGQIFYERKSDRKNNAFNLPKGNYRTANTLKKLSKPVSYSFPTLPQPERNGILPKKVILRKGDNPNKCSIVRDDRRRIAVIFADHAIFNLPRREKEVIMYHELGHCFYQTESKCDLFAAYHLIKKGYNPSQLAMSIFNSLSDGAIDRKCEISDFMQKVKMNKHGRK
jgi:hypothetical protein